MAGEYEQPQAATPEGLLADLLGTLPDPLDMSGEELDDLLTQVDDLVGLNPVLRQVRARSGSAGMERFGMGAGVGFALGRPSP
eukprot:11228771-Alexandrium_andersonii.AAC.1